MPSRLGRPTATIVLTAGEPRTLEQLSRRSSTALALARHSRIALAAEDLQKNTEIGAGLGSHLVTAGKWRRRFSKWRLQGQSVESCPAAPRAIVDNQVAAVIVKTLEAQPRYATHWSTRSLTAEMGLSQTAVSGIWRTFALKPHLVE